MNLVAGDPHVRLDGLGFLEGVVEHAGDVYFVDASGGGAWCISPGGGLAAVVEHRRGIGGLGVHQTAGFVVTGRNVAWKGDARRGETGTRILIEQNDDGRRGFNDLVVDGRGRIYVGSLGELPQHGLARPDVLPGHLYLIDVDGSVSTVADGLALTNGLAFAPDGSMLFHVDSGRAEVRRYDVRRDGSLSEPRVVFKSVDGVLDGAATRADGTIWIAQAYAGSLQVIDLDGHPVGRVPVGRSTPTSLAFGGSDGCDLYVATGHRPDRHEPGAILQLRSTHPGISAALCATPGPVD
jgi:gluconolactonase